jgi:hypothetical protein
MKEVRPCPLERKKCAPVLLNEGIVPLSSSLLLVRVVENPLEIQLFLVPSSSQNLPENDRKRKRERGRNGQT